MTNRRQFLRNAAVASAATAASVVFPPSAAAAPSLELIALARSGRPLPLPPAGSPEQVAQDEAYWREVAAQYVVTDAVTNLERATGE